MRSLLAIASLTVSLFFVPQTWAQKASSDVSYRPDVTITLRTDIADGKLVYVSESGATRGQVNPDIKVPEGAVVQINLVNGDGAVHDIVVPEFDINPAIKYTKSCCVGDTWMPEIRTDSLRA